MSILTICDEILRQNLSSALIIYYMVNYQLIRKLKLLMDHAIKFSTLCGQTHIIFIRLNTCMHFY